MKEVLVDKEGGQGHRGRLPLQVHVFLAVALAISTLVAVVLLTYQRVLDPGVPEQEDGGLVTLTTALGYCLVAVPIALLVYFLVVWVSRALRS
jgi:hypothetical protein